MDKNKRIEEWGVTSDKKVSKSSQQLIVYTYQQLEALTHMKNRNSSSIQGLI